MELSPLMFYNSRMRESGSAVYQLERNMLINVRTVFRGISPSSKQLNKQFGAYLHVLRTCPGRALRTCSAPHKPTLKPRRPTLRILCKPSFLQHTGAPSGVHPSRHQQVLSSRRRAGNSTTQFVRSLQALVHYSVI